MHLIALKSFKKYAKYAKYALFNRICKYIQRISYFSLFIQKNTPFVIYLFIHLFIYSFMEPIRH